MIRIMFVCHGNICRSPMAEFILKRLIFDADLCGDIWVSSSAVSDEEIWGGVGNPIDKRAKAEMYLRGIEFAEHRATLLMPEDAEKYDMLIGMDDSNISGMRRILGDAAEGKMFKLMDFADGGNVSDPWFTGRFDIAFEDIYRGCEGLLRHLKAEYGLKQ